jgi:hypothetical protein
MRDSNTSWSVEEADAEGQVNEEETCLVLQVLTVDSGEFVRHYHKHHHLHIEKKHMSISLGSRSSQRKGDHQKICLGFHGSAHLMTECAHRIEWIVLR